jgi:hypothetical protein
MKLKIEGVLSDQLVEIQKFIYDRNPELIVNEQYDMSPGFHKEPVVIALIIALGGPVVTKAIQSIIKEYFDYKKKELEANTKIKMAEIQKQQDMVRLSVERDKGWKYVDKEEFINMSVNQ